MKRLKPVVTSGRAGNHHVVPTNQIDHLPPPQQMIMTMMIMMGHCSLSQTKVQYTSTYRHKSTEGNATALQCDFIELHKFAAHSAIANMQFFGFHAVATGVMVRIILQEALQSSAYIHVLVILVSMQYAWCVCAYMCVHRAYIHVCTHVQPCNVYVCLCMIVFLLYDRVSVV